MTGYESLPDYCPHCGKPIVYGFLAHAANCARRRQEQLDREWARQQMEQATKKQARKRAAP